MDSRGPFLWIQKVLWATKSLDACTAKILTIKWHSFSGHLTSLMDQFLRVAGQCARYPAGVFPHNSLNWRAFYPAKTPFECPQCSFHVQMLPWMYPTAVSKSTTIPPLPPHTPQYPHSKVKLRSAPLSQHLHVSNANSPAPAGLYFFDGSYRGDPACSLESWDWTRNRNFGRRTWEEGSYANCGVSTQLLWKSQTAGWKEPWTMYRLWRMHTEPS